MLSVIVLLLLLLCLLNVVVHLLIDPLLHVLHLVNKGFQVRLISLIFIIRLISNFRPKLYLDW